MKRTVWTFGLLSGVLAIALMAFTLEPLREHRFGLADTLGYSSMVLAAVMVFFGIRSYREKEGEGRLSFARGLAVGALITAISGALYAVAFQLVYFQLAPDFGDVFVSCMVQRAATSGADAAELAATAEQAASLKRLYDQPLVNAVVSFATALPVGLGASALAALILRRR